METFVAVVECGSLSDAAKRLHANQPNLTVRIQKLESQLGVDLFDREGKKLILNPIGKRFYEQTKSLLQMYSDIRGEVELYKHPNFGHIRIGGGFQILLTTMPQFLVNFSQSYPNITYEINEIGPSKEIYQLVDQYELDFGLVDTKHLFEKIESIKLVIHTSIFLVFPINSVYAKHTEINAEDLSQLDFIAFKKDTPIRKYIESELENNDISLSIKMEINHIELMIKMIEMGIGAALLPISTGTKIFDNKEVKVLPVNGLEFTPRPIYFIYRKNRFYPPSLLQFMTEIRSYFNNF